MNLELDTINILIAIAATTNLLYGFLVYKRNKKSASNLAFFFLAVAMSTWGIAMIVFRSAGTVELALHAAKWLYTAAAAIPILFVLFSLLFPKDEYSLSKFQTLLLAIPSALIIGMIFLPNVFIKFVNLSASPENIIIFNPSLHLIYAIYVSGIFLISYLIFLRKYRMSDGVQRAQIIYILLGAMVPTFIGLITNLIFPLFGEFRWNWMGQISIAVTAGVITYGIFRHKIFNIRVIGAEMLIFILWLIALLRIILSESQTAVVFNISAFIAILVVGLLLIRSVNREVDTREKLEVLTGELKHANTRLKELDRQKSEFLSIATHQLRGPLAGIRGHLSLVIDGSYGEISKKAHEIIVKIFESSGMLAQTINDFLNVSRIEQGSMQYDKKKFQASELVKDIVEELQPMATDRGLELTFVNKCEEGSTIHADYAKIRHIFFNLIDNAIKYTEEGWVKVEITSDSSVHIEVKDSGVGIAPNEIHGLFEKFVRARDASGINVNGTGLGLYVARQMVEAHKGKIWAESEGKGKGSTFIVEIPASQSA